MSTFNLFELGNEAEGSENYTAQDTNICLEFEYNRYKRVKTDGRVNQSCKRKRSRPR